MSSENEMEDKQVDDLYIMWKKECLIPCTVTLPMLSLPAKSPRLFPLIPGQCSTLPQQQQQVMADLYMQPVCSVSTQVAFNFLNSRGDEKIV